MMGGASSRRKCKSHRDVLVQKPSWKSDEEGKIK
jgi:hypothetical protein